MVLSTLMSGCSDMGLIPIREVIHAYVIKSRMRMMFDLIH
jgi:hypothetical protein